MERLWAPWRMEFILAEKGPDCVFCLALKGKDDEKNFILHRGSHNFVMLNKFPYNNGHLIIVANEHVAGIKDMSHEAREEMMTLAGSCTEVLKEALAADGVNCGMNLGRFAGAGIEEHIHFHLVPRWIGDTNFFPVIADTKSMPEYLLSTYKRLRPAFAGINKRGK